MSEMVERVARALYEAMPRGLLWPTWAELSEWEYKRGYRDAARKIVEAMREPTEAMVVKGSAHCNMPGRLSGSSEHAANCWRAMIDEALK